MRIPWTSRTIFLTPLLVGILFWFLTPVASISPKTCNRIQPGMSEQEALEIVGVPIGVYDGVGSWRSVSPDYGKKSLPHWVGYRGEIIVELDDLRRVSKATYYPIEDSWRSVQHCMWERFTRIKYYGFSLPARIILHWALTAIVVLMLGFALVPSKATNSLASYGLLGLVVGPIFSVAMFPEGFFFDLWITFLILSSPISGALVGIGVGFTRFLWNSSFPSPQSKTTTGDAHILSASKT